MTQPLPRGNLPLSDRHRLKDLHAHVAACLVLPAKGGRIHAHCRRTTESAHRCGVRLLGALSRLLARITDDERAGHGVPPAATCRPS